MSIAVDRFEAAERQLFAATGTRVRFHFIEGNDKLHGVARIRILEAGRDDAPPLVMIHGGNSVAAGWEPLLSILQRDFHVYAPDRPGCGLTGKFDYHGVPFRMHGTDFVEAALNGLALRRATLVGNSMGGYWALLYALAYPERVERLVLVGEPAGSSPRPIFRLRLLGTPGVNRLLYATALRPNRARTRKQFGTLVAHPERISDAFLDLSYAASMLPWAQLGWTSMLERVLPVGHVPELTYALRPELPQLRVPTLFIWGDRDFCSPRWGRELCALIPQAQFTEIPETGHLAWLDSPQKVADLALSFLHEARAKNG